jgi:iron complex transport system substrate-binding protein
VTRFVRALLDALLLGLVLAAPYAQAQRIATMAPFLTELAFAAGAGDKVVGVAAHSNYPAQAKSLPIVADAAGANRESLLRVKPDIVLAWRTGTPLHAIDSLKIAGIPVTVMDGARIDDVPKLLRQIGVLAGTVPQAEEAAKAFEKELAALRESHATRKTVTAMFEIWHAPLMTIAGNHYMTDALEACGGRNVFADVAGIAPEISYESVIAKDPEAIVGAGSALDEAVFHKNWSRFGSLQAVKRGSLIYLNPDIIQQQTPRLIEGVKAICKGLEKVRAAQNAAPK